MSPPTSPKPVCYIALQVRTNQSTKPTEQKKEKITEASNESFVFHFGLMCRAPSVLVNLDEDNNKTSIFFYLFFYLYFLLVL